MKIIKRCATFLTSLTLLAALIFPVASAALANAIGTNLISNPSAETANGAQPSNWTLEAWGTNTTTGAYRTDGRTGSRSLAVTTTAYTNGDAKWKADAGNVTAGKTYTYTDYYKSGVPTELTVQYADANGALSYTYLKTLPAATSWTQASAVFTVPAGITKASVLHILYQVGTLQTDDFSLTENDPVIPPAPTSNLIPNPSFETVDPGNNTAPENWAQNKWGTNTASFTYDKATGRTGSKSVKVAVSSYTSGDAKWYSSPVAISPNQAYTFTDWYKASGTTRVVAAFVDAAGVYSYQELATAPASATVWKQYTATFTTPATASKVSVYHLVDKANTSLAIDDVSLIRAVPAPTPTGFIPNPSLEQAASGTPATPDQWTTSSWGTNKPTFQYVSGGRTGNKSVKVTVSNYTDGDAKWYFNPITTLQKGKQYRFTAWYKTNVTPKVVAMFNKADGTQQYFGMPNPFPASNSTTTWQKYSDTFSVPQDAVSTSVFMYVNQNGWLQTDDYSLESYTPVGFNRPLLTLTFDDGHEDNVVNALPLLNQRGIKTTQCFATEYIEEDPVQATSNVRAFYNSGHEICSHTVTHPMLTTVNSSKLTYELQHSQAYLQNIIGKPVVNFASPYGDYNAPVNNAIKKYYRSHRTVDEGYNSKDNLDRYRLRVQNILSTTTATQVEAWIKQAQADKTWLILVYHRIGANPEQFDTAPAVFAQHLDKIQQSGIAVKTYNDALDDVLAQ